MKKIIVALLSVFILAGSAFAVDLSADFNVALPFDFTTNKYNVDVNDSNYTHTTTKNKESGFGVDAGLKAMLTKQFGVKVNLGYYCPKKVTSTTTTVSKILGKESTVKGDPITTTYSDVYDSFSSFNVFVGPAIVVQDKKSYDITVTPGLSIDMRSASKTVGDQTKTVKYQYWGVGAQIDATYNLSKKLYLNFSCPAVYQFKIVDSDDNEAECNGFYLVPKIGVGYNF